MNKIRAFGGVSLRLIALVFIWLYVLDFLSDKDGQMADILMWLIIILVFFQGATWGTDKRAEKDEMGQQIKSNKGKISYHMITFILFAFWLIDILINENISSLGNIFLLAAFCLTIIIYLSNSAIFCCKKNNEVKNLYLKAALYGSNKIVSSLEASMTIKMILQMLSNWKIVWKGG